MIDVPLTAQLLVAAGTLALASATAWLAWNSTKERKSNDARELAVGAYNPLRAEIAVWINVETAYSAPASHDVWTSLKQGQLHLVARIPDPITTQLDESEPLVDRIRPLSGKVYSKAYVKTQEVFQELYHSQQGNINPRILLGGMFFDYLKLQEFGGWWIARKTLRDHMDAYAAKRFPGETWAIDVLGESNTPV